MYTFELDMESVESVMDVHFRLGRTGLDTGGYLYFRLQLLITTPVPLSAFLGLGLLTLDSVHLGRTGVSGQWNVLGDMGAMGVHE